MRNTKLSCVGCGSSIALSAAGHARRPRVDHGASLSPGRTLWSVLWAFKVAKLASNHGIVSPRARAKQVHTYTNLSYNFLFRLCFALVLLLLSTTAALRLVSHGTTSATVQACPFMTRYERCPACVCVCHRGSYRSGHRSTVSREVQFNPFLSYLLCCLPLLCTCNTT